MSVFTLTKGSAAALSMLTRRAGIETLLLTQPARELLAEITVQPLGTAAHGQIEAVLYLREQRHSMTLQRDDGANAQHLADWVEAAANGTLDTAAAIPQRTAPVELLPCCKCGREAIGYSYLVSATDFEHGVQCRHRECQSVEGAQTSEAAHEAWNAIQQEEADEPAAQQDEPGRDKDVVSVPRGLLGSACFALANRVDAPNTLAELRNYAFKRADCPEHQPGRAALTVALATSRKA